MMKIMIHSCNKRIEYVNNYLVPSLIKQGANDIIVFNDDHNEGCLKQWVSSCKKSLDFPAAWHLQDDVVICDDFYQRIKQLEGVDKIINGFVCAKHNPSEYKKSCGKA